MDVQRVRFLGHFTAVATLFSVGDEGGPGDFILAAATSWPRPYDDLMAAVDLAARTGSGSRGIPDGYYAEVRQFVRSKEPSLQCALPDFALIRAQYLAEIDKLEPGVDAELERYIESIRAPYAARGEAVKITAEFRAQARATIRAGKVATVEATRRRELAALREQCDAKADQALMAFRTAKGIIE